jgi:hypothetical protein
MIKMPNNSKGEKIFDQVENDVTKFKYESKRAKIFNDAISEFEKEGNKTKSQEMQ